MFALVVHTLLLAFAPTTQANLMKLLYTSNVAGHIFEVDGDGRTCTRYHNNGSLIHNTGNYQSLHACAGGAAGRKWFIDQYYSNQANGADWNDVVLLDTGNHFYGSREYFARGAEGVASFAKKLKYDAMALSSKDLHAEQSEIDAFVTSMNAGSLTVPFVASNLILNTEADPLQKKQLYKLINDTKHIKKYHVITDGSGDKIVVFNLLPKNAALRSRCIDTSDPSGSVQVLGQNAADSEWLMSQVSHMNRLWEQVKDELRETPAYAILLADLPMAQIVTLTRVLSFINVGIGPSAPTKKTGVCHPATMDAINCAPLNGQPMQVNSELGVKREIPNSGKLVVPCSLFLVPCSLFLVPCSLFLVPCSLFLFLLLGGRCLFFFFVSHTLFVSFVAWLFVSLLTLLLCGTVDSSLHHGHGFLVFLVLQFRPRGRHGLHQCDVPLHWQRSGSGGV
jgi:hypothetical protein